LKYFSHTLAAEQLLPRFTAQMWSGEFAASDRRCQNTDIL